MMTYLISFLAVVVLLLGYGAIFWAILGLGYLIQRGLSKIKGVKKWYYRYEYMMATLFLLTCIAAVLFFGTLSIHGAMFGAMFP